MLIEKCSLSHLVPLGVEETGKDTVLPTVQTARF